MPSSKKTAVDRGKKGNNPVPIKEIHVVLKPIQGIPPKIYVSIAWSLIAVLAVFLLLVLPGVRKNGTQLTVRSLPADASVFIDGTRLGSSGEPVFAPKGERVLTVSRAGFSPYEERIEIKGRLFASRIFPRRQTLDVVLDVRDGIRPLAEGFREYALWSATGTERERYAIPPSLTSAARDALALDDDGQGLLESSLPLATDERHLADILRADFLLASEGAPLGASTLVEYADFIARRVQDNQASYTGIVLTVAEESSDHLGWTDLRAEAEEDYLSNTDAALNYYRDVSIRRPSAKRFLGGTEFVAIPASSAFIGDIEAVADGYRPRSGAYPTPSSVETFLIGAKEISNAEFSVFVEADPQWAPGNRDALVQAGLADEDYLAGWTLTSPPSETASEPVTGISWYAATAYAEWFTDHYLAGTDAAAALPRENQWEIAARLNGIAQDTSELAPGLKNTENADKGTLGLVGMAGNVREWCSNPYRTNEYLYKGSGGPEFQTSGADFASPERTVRGGAYIDGKLPFPAAIRGGLRPNTTSPVIGFRLVIIE